MLLVTLFRRKKKRSERIIELENNNQVSIIKYLMPGKCRYCSKPAEITFVNGRLCRDHFFQFYYEYIEKAIDKYYPLLKRREFVLAISGGKDSTSLCYALSELGYRFSLYHINLGIGDFSKKSLSIVKRIAADLKLDLFVDDIKKYGIVIKQIGRRSPCSICGIVKRYLSNKFCVEQGFKILTTAHNLDDVVTFIIKDFIIGNIGSLIRNKPALLERKELNLCAKFKPMVFIPEEANYLFLNLKGIEFVREACPLVGGNTQRKWKAKILNFLKDPACRYQFLVNFYRLLKEYGDKLKPFVEKEKVKKCKICGFPTTKDVCSFCRIVKLFKERK